MKTFIAFCMVWCLGFVCSAQTKMFKPFKVDINIGYAFPQGSGAIGGAAFSIEPKYGISDQFDLGLRLGVAATARGVPNGTGGYSSGKVKANASYILTGDYFFTTSNTRPFLGAGLGPFTFAGVSANSSGQTYTVPATTKFGEMVRGGVEIGHLRLTLEYNFIPNGNGYLAATIGAKIGGGRIKK